MVGLDTDVFCTEAIERQTYFDTRNIRVVYDIAPVTPGHSLLIPKRHVTDAALLTEEEMLEMLDLVKLLRVKLIPFFNAEDSYDLIIQVGKYSGMSVPHIHMHFIPRHKNDKFQVDNDKLYSEVAKGPAARRLLEKIEYSRIIGSLRKEFRYKGGQ